jgi:O-antigen ligase
MAPRLGLWLCGLVWAGWLLAAPFLLGAVQPMLAAAPTSWEMRGAIWRYAAARIAEKPWLGWGLEASRGFDGVHVVDGVAIPSISLHPHCASLQIWLELGGVGAVLWAGALLLGARTGAQLMGADRARAAAAGGAAAVAFVLWNLSYGAWQEWLWAAAAAGAAAALSTPAAAQQPRTVLVME